MKRARFVISVLCAILIAHGCNFAEDLDEIEAEAEAERASRTEVSELCDDYCDGAMAKCDTSQTRIFDSLEECHTACADFNDRGVDGEMSGDTVQCRLYHLSVAATDPTFHCPHAAEDGGGVCVGSSPCASYCGLMRERCSDERFGADPDDDEEDVVEECIDTCREYSISGQDGDTSGDTFQCRKRAALSASDDPATLCPQAAPDGGGVCVGPPP